jgi:hypothetical protein
MFNIANFLEKFLNKIGNRLNNSKEKPVVEKLVTLSL